MDEPEWKTKRRAKWILLVVLWSLRLGLCLWPQYGYIHPDEFFQGLEPMTGAVMNYNVSLPWEFTDEHPIRNILFPGLSVGLPATIMRFLFGSSGVSALSLLRAPRILVCLLSFLVDAAMYLATKEVGRDPLYPLLVLNSSHVMHVYSFRTMSNAMELVLFALLLYRLTKCFVDTDWRVELKSKKKETTEDKDAEDTSSRREAEDLAIITVLGFFNRPTFLFFAFPALLAFAIKDHHLGHYSLWNVTGRLAMFAPAALSAMFMVSALDTLFYRGQESLSKGPVLTPMNFIAYNLNPRNLALHGIHKPWTHFAVNLPLLFGILPFVAMYVMARNWIPAIWKETALKVERRVDYVMMASFLFPVLILTLFKHQEPRFLIPVLFPLVYVAHDKFFKPGVLSKVLLGSWIVSNVLLTYFYGVMHQAGIPPMLIYVSRNLQRTGQGLHLISTYSYSMPQFLLANPRGSGFPIHTYDLGSTDLYQVIEFACGFHDALPALVAMPGSMTERHLVSGNGTCADSGLWKVASSVSRKYGVVGHPGVQFCRQASFSPHLTTEFLPVISNVTFSEVFRAVEQLRLDLFLIKCS